MTREDFNFLEEHYERLFKMVVNQAVTNMTIDLKERLLTILKSEGRAQGLCGKCNSALLGIATEAVTLYKENKDKFNNNNDAETKEPQIKKRRRRQSTGQGENA